MNAHIETIMDLPRGTKMMVCEPVQVRASLAMGREAANLMVGKTLYVCDFYSDGTVVVEDECGDLLTLDLEMCDHLEVAK